MTLIERKSSAAVGGMELYSRFADSGCGRQSKSRHSRVVEGLGALSSIEQIILALHYIEGLGIAAISQVLEISEEHVEHSMARAHQRLRAGDHPA